MKSKKIGKILISWLGDRDIKALCKGSTLYSRSCPLLSVLGDCTYGPYDELWLFRTPAGSKDKCDDHMRDDALEKLIEICDNAGVLLRTVLTPRNFMVGNMDQVYAFMLGELRKLNRHISVRPQFYFNLTSGTQAMLIIQHYISNKTDYAGISLYTMDPEQLGNDGYNVFEANLPDKLSHNDEVRNTSFDFYTKANAKIYEQVRNKVASTNASVLIQGETGTGKTLLAEYIHNHDRQRNKNTFWPVNCAALGSDENTILSALFGHKVGAYSGAIANRKGAFEMADKGTLFLDEIGEIPIRYQAILLKALDSGTYTPFGEDKEKTIDVRLICATNVNLADAIREGRFRADLYYRIAQYTPVLKPFRNYTKEQKKECLDYCLDQINRDYPPLQKRELTDEARDLLLGYPWPGNFRELKFRLRSICLLSDCVVTAEDVQEQIRTNPFLSAASDTNVEFFLPSDFPPEQVCAIQHIPNDLNGWLKNWERYWVKCALKHYPTLHEAAKKLDIPPSTLSQRKARLGLNE